ncbi:hypothetical protein FJT64_017051 [Amphibalanus amphitrite]|uniref:Uncharacterized protein n=1 Tax=Amphibalanus amphitrite TaxID=1232801 RepID=A0A6A4WAL6_AMPAM|nr:hypothetical protein FJT64_026829 [Amphibalanus amphitrite]KAF0300681.1 hypothetical protein FJT64_026830 [Amphibalanus amphitrite]KAF0312208.1 hypothetical protein FJT64_017051 [Amphibalanus amphitrite]
MARPVPLADPLAEVVTYEERMPVVLRRRGCLMTVRIVSVDEPPAPESPPVPRAARPDQLRLLPKPRDLCPSRSYPPHRGIFTFICTPSHFSA